MEQPQWTAAMCNSNSKSNSKSDSSRTTAMSQTHPHAQQSQLQNSNGWRRHWTGAGSSHAPSNSIGITSRAIWLGRILFVTVLVAVASTLGYAAFRMLTNAEDDLAEAQFFSIAQRALVEAQAIAHRRRWAGLTMAATLSEMYPDASSWPFVEFLGFERMARSMLKTASGEDMGFAVHLTPEQVPQFEDFAYSIYDKLGFPNGTGYSHFGRGIWAQNVSLPPPNNRYHDTMGNTSGYDSPYRILTPLFRVDEGRHALLMFNPHSGFFQGEAIDRMLSCTYEQKVKGSGRGITYRSGEADTTCNCTSITDMFSPAKFAGKRWGAILTVPIFPANDPFTVVGHVTPLIMVDELLKNVFAKEVSGIDAVLQTETISITYRIDNGVARLVGEGDHRDLKYDKYSESVDLLDASMYTKDAPVHRFILTPNNDFYTAYETNNPLVATLGTFFAILLTALGFFLYDFFVRREFNTKQELLEARRTFMRFVSHEVRTPLNAVYMGLDLMQSELAKVLDFESTTSLRAAHDFNFVGSEQQKEQDAGNSNAGEDSANQSGLLLPTDLAKHANWLTRQKALEWFHLAHEIQGNTQGAVDILNDLLNYDKIEQGTLHLELEVLSVWDLIETSILEFKLSASSKKIHLSVSFAIPNNDNEEANVVNRACQLPDDLRQLRVIGDSVRLTQVLRNLMSNALKFTPAMGSVKVKVACLQSDSHNHRMPQQVTLKSNKTVSAISRGSIEVLVEDTGAGMLPNQLSRVFLDGVQFNVNELQAGNGSGLGLYIAKGLVKQHKGSLSASSDGLGQGTTFTMSLPIWELPELAEINDNKSALAKKSSSDSEVVSNSYSPSSSIAASSVAIALRVLVVDDVSSNRKLLKRILENAGHNCDDADNGQKAVDMVKQAAASDSPYDSVLMDYEMPIMNGPTAAKEIRDLGFDVCIVGITGNVLPADIAYFKQCGANDVLPKPIKIAALDASWMGFGIYEPRDERPANGGC